MPSLSEQGMSHPRIPDSPLPTKCFLHRGYSKTSLTTIVINCKKNYDTISRESVCCECIKKLPTKKIRLATKKEEHRYLEEWANRRMGK